MNLKYLEKGLFVIISVLMAVLLMTALGTGFISIMDKLSELLCLFI